MRRTLFRLAAPALLLTLALLAATLRPARAAAPAAGQPSAIFAGFTVASFNHLQDLLAQLPLPVPPQFQPRSIERVFEFLGRGGLDRRLPAGFFFLMGDSLTDHQNHLLALPVRPDVFPLGQLRRGGKPVAGTTDTFLLQPNDVPFRRTANYLMFGGTAEEMTRMKEGDVTGRFTNRERAAHLFLNFKLFRTAAPRRFGEFMADLRSRAPAEPEERLTYDLLYQYLPQHLDQVSFWCDQNAQGLTLAARVEPMAFTPQPLPRPALPEGGLFRLDLQMAGNQVRDILQPQLTIDAQALYPQASAGEQQAIADFFTGFADLLFGGDAVSLTLEIKAGKVAAYAVTQRRAARDLKADIDRLLALDATASKAVNVKPMKFETSEGPGGATVYRLAYYEKKHPAGLHFDFFQRGTVTLIGLGEGDDKPLDRLLPLGLDGQLNSVVTFTIDLERTVAALATVPDSSVAKLERAEQRKLGQLVAGQKLTLEGQAARQGLELQLQLPQSLLTRLAEIYMLFAPDPDAADAP